MSTPLAPPLRLLQRYQRAPLPAAPAPRGWHAVLRVLRQVFLGR